MRVNIGSYVILTDPHGQQHYGRIYDMDNPETGWAVMREAGTGHGWTEPADSPAWALITRQQYVGAARSASGDLNLRRATRIPSEDPNL